MVRKELGECDLRNLSRVRTIKELAKRALGEEQKSLFTKRIDNASLPKKFSVPKFSIYGG